MDELLDDEQVLETPGFAPDSAPAPFDPEGDGYDMESATAAGLQPDETGHWPSRDPDSGLILKGRKHKTYHLTEQGEADAGYEITPRDGRYYSQPRGGKGGGEGGGDEEELLSDDAVLMSDDDVLKPAAASTDEELLSDEDILMSDADVLKPRGPAPEGPGKAFLREAAHSVVPTLASLPAMAAGIAVGAPAGPVGSFAGAVAGGMGGGFAAAEAQDRLLKLLGYDDDAQRSANKKAHPKSSFAGELAPSLLAFSTGRSLKAFKEITLGQRGVMLGAGSGLEAGKQAAFEDEMDWGNVAMAGAFNAVAAKTTKLGEGLMAPGTKVGEQIAARLAARGAARPGHPSDTESTVNPTDTAHVDNGPGTAAVQPPPVSDATAPGGSQSPTRQYPKENAKQAAPLLGGLDPAAQKALTESIGKTTLDRQVAGPTPEPQVIAPKQVPDVPQPAPGSMEGIPPVLPKPNAPAPQADTTGLAAAKPLEGEILPPVDRMPPIETKTKTGEVVPPSKPLAEPTYVPGAADRYKLNVDGPNVTIVDRDGNVVREVPGKMVGLKISEGRKILKEMNAQPQESGLPSARELRDAQTTQRIDKSFEDYANRYDDPVPPKPHGMSDEEWQQQLSDHYRSDPDNWRARQDWEAEKARDKAAGQPTIIEGEVVKKNDGVTEVIAKYAEDASPEEAAAMVKELRAKFKEVVANKDSDPATVKKLKAWLEANPEPEVKQSKVVREAIAEAEKRGMSKIAEVLKNAGETADAQADKFLRGLRAMDEGRDPSNLKDVKTPRIPAARPKVEGLGVQARDPKDAARKTGVINALKAAYDKHAPDSEIIPTSKADIAKLRERLTAAVKEATEANGGNDPFGPKDKGGYNPRVKTPEYQWVKAARDLIGKKMTPKQVSDFVAKELMLRKGGEEGATIERQIARTDSDIAMNRRVADENLDGKLDVPHEESEALVKPEPVTKVDDPPHKEIDITKMTPEQSEAINRDMDQIAENLIKEADKRAAEAKASPPAEEEVPKWKQALEADKAKEAAKRERLKALREGRKAQASPKTPEEMAQAAAAEAQRVSNKDKPTLSLKKQDQPKPDGILDAEDVPLTAAAMKAESTVNKFINDESGEVNVKAVTKFFRDNRKKMREWARHAFGTTHGERDTKGDAILAKAKSAEHAAEAENMHVLEADQEWVAKKLSLKENVNFIDAMEKHNDLVLANNTAAFKQELIKRGFTETKAEKLAVRAPFYRELLEKAWQMENAVADAADHIEGYFPHMFKDPQAVQEWLNGRISSMGKSFQKERTFEFLKDALDAKFELKYDNFVDALIHRLNAGRKMVIGLNTLDQLEGLQLAANTKKLWAPPQNASAERLAKMLEAQNSTTSRWHKVNAADGTQWRIHPDIMPHWKAAMEDKGLWGDKGMKGKLFRGWMAAKNVYVPLKLMASLFHFVHVIANVNIAENIRRVGKEDWKDMPAAAIKEIGRSFSDPLLSLPLEKIPGLGKLLPDAFRNYEGKQFREIWKTPDAELTEWQRSVKHLFQEAGIVTEMNPMLKIKAKQDFAYALKLLSEGKLIKGAPRFVIHGVRRAIEHTQAWMFEEMIPNLKVAQMLRATEQLLRLNPELHTNAAMRGVAMRALGKSIDNRFGEMFYGSLFWNKTAKDLGVGGMLSLGWNLGQVREFGGAIMDIASGRAFGKGPKAKLQAYEAAGRGAYSLTYAVLSMLSAGLINYALTGTKPEGLDYTYPRSGGKGPDGTDHRIGLPFNTREIPMFLSHMEEYGGPGVLPALAGLNKMFWNKTVVSPVTNAFNNRDYFGNQLYDPHAPWFQATAQLIDSTLGDMIAPISMLSAQRMADIGQIKSQNPLKDPKALLPYAGFGAAPAYISRSGMQNKISHAFNVYGQGSTTRPYAESGTGFVQGAYRHFTDNPTQVKAKQQLRAELNRAYSDGDEDAINAVKQKMASAKGEDGQPLFSKDAIKRFVPGEGDKYQFGRIPLAIQRQLVKEMTPQEFERYVVRNRAISRNKTFPDLLKARGGRDAQ